MSEDAIGKSRGGSDTRSSEGAAHSGGHSGSSYGRFLAMVGTSTAIMFGLMYINSYSFEHVYWSETRFYMTFIMGATIATVMLLFSKRCLRPTRDQLDVVKFQGISSSILLAG